MARVRQTVVFESVRDTNEAGPCCGAGRATRMLALQVESCSPRLIASRVDACWRPSGFRPGFWPQGQSNQATPLSPASKGA